MKMIVVNQQLQYVYCPISQEVKVTINFDQLIEYGMPKNFLKNSNMKCGGKTITKPSSRKTRLKCLWINSLKFHIVCFYCMPRWGLPTTCFNLIEIFFKKNNKRSETSLPSSFSTSFYKKNICEFIFCWLAKFNFLVVFTSWDYG